MSATTQNSVEYAASIANPIVMANPSTSYGRRRIMCYTFVQSGAGDAGSLALLAQLPAGVVRVLGAHVNASAMGSSRTLDFGHYGYTGLDNVAVVADPDAFFSNKDISSAVDTFYRAGDATVSGVTISSNSGFIVTAQINDGGVDAGETLNGWIDFVID